MNEVPVIGPLRLCAQPVTNRIEAYRPANGHMHGSLDWAVYTCTEHVDQHHKRVQVGTQVGPKCYGNGFRQPVLEPAEYLYCGYIFDYTQLKGGVTHV